METEEVVQDSIPQESSSSETAPNSTTGEGTAPEVFELDKLEKFMYGGREWTQKDLQGSIMMQSDYTRKTQSVAKEKEFISNLKADIRSLRKEPTLIEEFKKLYPKDYHDLADSVIEGLQSTNVERGEKKGVDPQMDKRLATLEKYMQAEGAKTIEAQMTSTFAALKPKYPLAFEESVLAMADMVVDRAKNGEFDERFLDQETGRISDAGWEKIFKSIQERNKKAFDSQYKTMVEGQK